MSRLMRFLPCLTQRTYSGGLQNPLARLEELRRRQSEVLEHPERLFSRLAGLPDRASFESAPEAE